MRRKAGFTLIELLIALLIIAMVSSVLLISYKQYTESKEKEEAMITYFIDLNNIMQDIEHKVKKGITSGLGRYNGIEYTYRSRVVSQKYVVDYSSNKRTKLILIRINLRFKGNLYSWEVVKSESSI